MLNGLHQINYTLQGYRYLQIPKIKRPDFFLHDLLSYNLISPHLSICFSDFSNLYNDKRDIILEIEVIPEVIEKIDDNIKQRVSLGIRVFLN